MCRSNNICSLFQAESVIMTFQFHLENIPFFRCLQHKPLPLDNKTLRNSQEVCSGCACCEWYCWCNVMVRLQWWQGQGQGLAIMIRYYPMVEEIWELVWYRGEHIRPDRPSCNLNKRDKITEQGCDWSSSLLHQVTAHLVSHFNWLKHKIFQEDEYPVTWTHGQLFLSLRGERCEVC